jgi:hypothetical protein
MKTFLHIILFNKIYTEKENNKYVINSIDSIKIQNDMILFKGEFLSCLNNKTLKNNKLIKHSKDDYFCFPANKARNTSPIFPTGTI